MAEAQTPETKPLPGSPEARETGRRELNAQIAQRQKMLLAGIGAVALLGGAAFIFSGDSEGAGSDPNGAATIDTGGLVNRNLSQREFVASYGNRLDAQGRAIKDLQQSQLPRPTIEQELEALRSEGRLRPSPEVQLGATPASVHAPDRSYFATKLITTGIVANNRAPFQPRSWADLLRPEARNQTVMPSPAVSGAAAIHILTKIQNPALGWDYLTRLAQHGLQPRGGNGQVMQAVAQGERAFGIVVDFLAPAHEGDRLLAEGREVSRSGSTGVYDITVTNQHGKTVAVMRGRSHTMKGRHVVEL